MQIETRTRNYIRNVEYSSRYLCRGAKCMSVEDTIRAQFEQVAIEQRRKLKLLDCGLDSLSFALIVARLEDALGFDPFDVTEEMKFPVTYGDFVKLYENHSK
jgi:hypothetical protein